MSVKTTQGASWPPNHAILAAQLVGRFKSPG
jgi:hypothetical protein